MRGKAGSFSPESNSDGGGVMPPLSIPTSTHIAFLDNDHELWSHRDSIIKITVIQMSHQLISKGSCFMHQTALKI